QGFRNTINAALLIGDGIDKPLGILNPASGIPICDTASATAPGAFTWQDLILLKWELPQQWHANGAYIMNQRTFAQILTMSDATGRPIMLADPTQPGRMLINGSPVILTTWMPNVEPGATPVAFGDWRAA